MAEKTLKWEEYTPDEQAARSLIGQHFGPMYATDLVVNAKGYEEYVVICRCGKQKVKSGSALRTNKNQSCGRDCRFFQGTRGMRFTRKKPRK